MSEPLIILMIMMAMMTLLAVSGYICSFNIMIITSIRIISGSDKERVIFQ
ncbi:MAG: hypothetical protein GY795_49315 [Desulfobacterales bacterium]|nr:hypothetical protein [Desulfobacterales bacterium]